MRKGSHKNRKSNTKPELNFGVKYLHTGLGDAITQNVKPLLVPNLDFM